MELYKLSALDTINLLKSEEVSPLDCLNSLQNRIDEVNQHVNALPTLCFDRAEQKAKNIMKRKIHDRENLYGLPIVIKDLIDVEGVKCTSGSLIFKDRIAEKSDILVDNIEKNCNINEYKNRKVDIKEPELFSRELFNLTL